MRHEAVIGLEVHVQLRTSEKLFTAAPTAFGAPPNTHVSPVCLGLPGALPVLNGEAVELAVRAALALDCTVHEHSVFARKNYFYPDLPKGYQISQFDRPLATGGAFEFDGPDGADGPDRPVGSGGPEGSGSACTVRIHRVHLEEDAGKSLHDRFSDATAVDLNRAGVPLVEIVSEPDLRSPAQARAFLTALKRLLEYLDVSDCNMEEGSLRVDANVSIRPPGSDVLNTKTEVKNLNSFSGVEKALELEIARQIEATEAGEPIRHQTLLWDGNRAELRPMRSKEESHDYRYFPDPDLPPLRVPRERIRAIGGELPERPRARSQRIQEEYGIPGYDADVLTSSRASADFFEETARVSGDGKAASNWVMGPVRSALKRAALTWEALPVSPGELAALIGLIEDGTISGSAGKRVFSLMISTGRDAREIVEEEGLARVHDADLLVAWVEEALAAHPEAVTRYRQGDSRVFGFFMGEVMKKSGGAADPKEVTSRLRQALDG